MFDTNVLSIQIRSIRSWWWENFGWQLRRIWRNFPQTTTDPDEKAFRRKYFKEAMRHEWGSLKYHQLFDCFYSGLKLYRRQGKRSWHQLHHPQSSVRWFAASYVSNVGR